MNVRNILDYEKQYLTSPFERYSEKYRREVVKNTIENHAKKGGVVVEIGCGVLPLFADYKDTYSFIVIEPGNYCFENAKKLAQGSKHVQCYQGFFEDVIDEIEEEKISLIVCSGLLHEIRNPSVLLQNIRRLCGQDTIVHINVPNALSFHRILAWKMELIEDVHQFSERNRDLQQHAVFDMKTLKQLVNEENFKIIEEGSYFLKPFTHKQMQQCIDLEIINDDILNGLNGLCESHFKEYGSEIYLNIQLK